MQLFTSANDYIKLDYNSLAEAHDF